MKLSISIILILLIFIVFLLVNTNTERFYNHKVLPENKWGSKWNGGGHVEWLGSRIYPVSINCNCPDNYDFIDNLCVNRNSPFNSITPKCYD
jgi:hypothetical protein